MSVDPGTSPEILVAGGGLSGLVAAYRIRAELPGASITVLEAGDRLGGKLDTTEFPSGPVELGAEAFIGRRAEASDLVAELGLGAELVHPSALSPALLHEGRLHDVPRATLMGIPSDPDSLATILSRDELARARAEESLPLDWEPGVDAPLGELVASRFGPAVVDRLVDPLLGGVYAAPSAGLSLREVVPGLAAELDRGASSLTAAARALVGVRRPGPVFVTFATGYRTLVEALARGSGARLRTGTRVVGLAPQADGRTRVDLRTAAGPESLTADAVVLALPLPALRTVLPGTAPGTLAELAPMRTASSAVVAMEVDRRLDLPERSGVLVAAGEDVPYKAMTFSSRKWPHLDTRPGHLVRVSFGRLGDEAILAADDTRLRELAAAGLTELCGSRSAARVLHSTVRRWEDGLPEIAPGHAAMVRRARAVAEEEIPGTEIVGAATEGVGVPACIGAARAAAHRIARRWQD